MQASQNVELSEVSSAIIVAITWTYRLTRTDPNLAAPVVGSAFSYFDVPFPVF